MGNKKNRRSRRLETPSLSREENVENPNPGNMTLTDSNLVYQENLGPNILENQLTEPSQSAMQSKFGHKKWRKETMIG